MPRTNPLDSALEVAATSRSAESLKLWTDHSFPFLTYLCSAVSLCPSQFSIPILSPAIRLLVLLLVDNTTATNMSATLGVKPSLRSNPNGGHAKHEQLLAARLNLIALNPDQCLPSAMNVPKPEICRRSRDQDLETEGNVDYFPSLPLYSSLDSLNALILSRK